MSQKLERDLYLFLLFGFCCYSSHLCLYFGNPQRITRAQILPQQPAWPWEGNPDTGLGSGVTRPGGTIVTSLYVPYVCVCFFFIILIDPGVMEKS